MNYIKEIFGSIRNMLVFLGASAVSIYMFVLRNKVDDAKNELNEYKTKIQEDSLNVIKKSQEEKLESIKIEVESKDSVVKELKTIDNDIDDEMRKIINELNKPEGTEVELKI